MELCKKKTNSKIIERFSNDGTFDFSEGTKIGTFKTITQNMEVSFEMKIPDMDSCDVGDYNLVLEIGGLEDWFDFAIRKSTQESKFYINHEQENGLGRHNDIQEENPISCSNSWKKEFLFKF